MLRERSTIIGPGGCHVITETGLGEGAFLAPALVCIFWLQKATGKSWIAQVCPENLLFQALGVLEQTQNPGDSPFLK